MCESFVGCASSKEKEVSPMAGVIAYAQSYVHIHV
jgi:hypothetical protein